MRFKPAGILIILPIFVMTLLLLPVYADDNIEIMFKQQDGPMSKCYIGALTNSQTNIEVFLSHVPEEIYGFDFLMAYLNNDLTIIGVYENPVIFGIPGEYEWEYFSYSFPNIKTGTSAKFIQIIALANLDEGVHNPIIDSGTGKIRKLPDEILLFTITFQIPNDYRLECSFMPIAFYWRNCRDNVISLRNEQGNSITAICSDVFGYSGIYFPITDTNATFPTYYGASSGCVNDTTVRRIDFKDGGIKIACSDDIACRGDVNLNGKLNEMADASLFANYLLYGREVFTINFEGQRAATDINANGIASSVDDLVFLIRNILGDEISFDDYSTKTNCELIQNQRRDNLALDITNEIPLGAVYLTYTNIADLEGVEFDCSIGNMLASTSQRNDSLNILIYGLDIGAGISPGTTPLLQINYSGEPPQLASSQISGYYGETMLVEDVTKIIPEQSELHQNSPNPFNSSTLINFALAQPGQWSIDIFNITGQKVRTFSGTSSAGPQSIRWDGTDSNGGMVSSGLYLYRLKTAADALSKKMMLLK